MTVLPRAAATAAVLAALAATPAAASPVTATIRAVSDDGTVVLPQTTLQTDARAITSDDFVTRPLLVPSALTLLFHAGEATGTPVGCGWSVDFNDCFVHTIGAVSYKTSLTQFWRLVVNFRDAQTGFGGTGLREGDHVDAIGTDFTQAPVPLLGVTVSGDRLAAGTSFQATVLSHDTFTGAATPAAGAAVRYGTAEATADAAGHATFVATGNGDASVSASLLGATASQSLTVCAYATDPTVCDLPAPAPTVPTPPTPVTVATTPDTVPPSSRITAPRLFGRVRHVTRIAGLAAPDRSDVARIEYALARRVGTLCRFRTLGGSYATARSCGSPLWLPARGRAFWTASLHRALAPGRYRVFSRAYDGAGNREGSLVTGASSGSFTVVG